MTDIKEQTLVLVQFDAQVVTHTIFGTVTESGIDGFMKFWIVREGGTRELCLVNKSLVAHMSLTPKP